MATVGCANEAGATSLVIARGITKSVCRLSSMRLVRGVDIVKCLMKNDKKVDD